MSARLSRALLFAAIAAGVIAMGARSADVWINLSPSLPMGIYRTVRGPIARGSIVVVCLPESVALFARQRKYLTHGSCPGAVEPLGKTVAAVAGDTVSVTANGVAIDGRLIPESRPMPRDSHGRLLAPAPLASTVLRQGQLFLLSVRRPGSFDSRYFGVVPATGVRVMILVLGSERR